MMELNAGRISTGRSLLKKRGAQAAGFQLSARAALIHKASLQGRAGIAFAFPA